jgi:drug/metabolite transporter (DMT)-like permease
VRTALGALVLAPLAVRRGGLAPLRTLALPVLALAAIQVAGPFLLISEGERWIASSLAGILVASAPIFTALIALGLTGEERANRWSVIGLAVGIAGVALLLGVDAGGTHLALLGACFVLLAGLGYAIGSYMVRRGFRSLEPVGLVAATMSASALLVLPFALATLPSHDPRAGTWAALAALGVGGTGVAFVLFYTLIQRHGPARGTIVAYIAPAFAVLYGVTLRGEHRGRARADPGGLLAGCGGASAGAWTDVRISAAGRGTDVQTAPIAHVGAAPHGLRLHACDNRPLNPGASCARSRAPAGSRWRRSRRMPRSDSAGAASTASSTTGSTTR